jgi:hypothetical protein
VLEGSLYAIALQIGNALGNFKLPEEEELTI